MSLVLGSGGARGLAHIGVIHWLEEHGYQIRSISGCSMGALVGGVHAAGKLDEYEQWARAITRLDIVTLLDVAWSRTGLVRGDRIINALAELVGDQQIEDLPVPFTAVAADVKRQREVWIQSGPLFDAIRASISLPILFTPFRRHGVDLIDGGVLNPMPIAPTFRDHTDMTIAVDAGGSVDDPIDPKTQLPLEKTAPSLIRDRLQGFISQMKESLGSSGEQEWAAFDVVNDAFDAMQSTIARLKIAASPPDKVIVIPKNRCKMLEFHRADELIDFGYQQAARTLA
ncbi:patatin-like phospholipase family protein [Rubripirellula lacrimiformis]|uniref:patatin-like phospholipase family protein n=1 Tax=Rubripirellula lacrimiformis TaxID=1930273 RepID=UPI001C54F9E3|nr:patatin-like phospholipase family protein [Rubripirellula lacrimiformis]